LQVLDVSGKDRSTRPLEGRTATEGIGTSASWIYMSWTQRRGVSATGRGQMVSLVEYNSVYGIIDSSLVYISGNFSFFLSEISAFSNEADR
jgi:hypothetical protein